MFAPQASYHAIKTGHVRTVSKLADAPARPAGAPAPGPLPPINLELVKGREERAILKAKDDEAHVNEAVTQEATRADDLPRTHPAHSLPPSACVARVARVRHACATTSLGCWRPHAPPSRRQRTVCRSHPRALALSSGA